MGAIGGMLGLGGGAGGTSFSGPQAADLYNVTNYQQLGDAYSRSRDSMNSQKALLEALQGAGGIQNQSSVFNQLQGVASGTGPNPAQAMLNNATGQNVANQAALMAGQRGAAQNVGLMARQAAMQGANTQQQAVGQAANMQANQSLNALNQLGGIAQNQVANQTGVANQYTGNALNEQQALLNAAGNLNNARVAMTSNVNSANAGMAGQQMKNTGTLIGGVMNSLGGAAKAGTGAAYGGMLADGGAVQPVSSVGKMLCGGGTCAGGGMVDVVVSPGEKIALPGEVEKVKAGQSPNLKTVPGKPEVSGDSLKNDKVPAKLPAGTVVVKRTRANNNPEGFIRQVLAKRKGRK